MMTKVRHTDYQLFECVKKAQLQPSEIMSSIRSRTSTAPGSPTGFSILATKTYGPAALPKAILLMVFVIISVVIGSLEPSTGLSSVRLSGFIGNSTLSRRS